MHKKTLALTIAIAVSSCALLREKPLFAVHQKINGSSYMCYSRIEYTHNEGSQTNPQPITEVIGYICRKDDEPKIIYLEDANIDTKVKMGFEKIWLDVSSMPSLTISIAGSLDDGSVWDGSMTVTKESPEYPLVLDRVLGGYLYDDYDDEADTGYAVESIFVIPNDYVGSHKN